MRKKENFKNLISDTMDNDQRRGFTMVELIVVLVIVAILSAVVIPLMMGFIENAREKEYITDAEAALKASQSALTEVYNNASNRITPERREKAHSESGTDINSRFDIWTAAILEDGITPAISDNISSYSVTYAEFTAEDGTRVFYNGSEWTVYKKDAEIEDAAYASLSNDADNVIHMWPYRGDKAYDPKAKPYVNNDFEDKIEFDFDGFKVLFIEENEDGRLVFNDNEYSHEVSYSEEGEGVFSETAAEIESIIKLDAKYKSVKWLYTGEEGVYSDDISQALAYAKELYENDKVQNGVVVFKADLLGDTAAFTAFFAPYKEDTQTVSVEGTTDDTNSLTFEIDKVSKEIKCVNKPDFDITKDDLDFISASQNSLIKDAGAVTSTGDWLHVENAGTGNTDDSYEMSNGSYKIYSLDSDGANVKDYIIDSLNALAEDEPGADSDVTFKTPAYIHKTVHLKAYNGEKNETDDFHEYKTEDGHNNANAVEFSQVGSNDGSPTYDISYRKSEISDIIKDENHEDAEFTISYEKDDNNEDVPVLKKAESGDEYKISDYIEWEAKNDGEKFKYWYLYESDKNYDSSGNIKVYGTEQKERPAAVDGSSQRDCTNIIIEKLFDEENIHYGEVAEIDLSDLNALLVNNGDVDVTGSQRNKACVLRNEFNKLTGVATSTADFNRTNMTDKNQKIRSIQYKSIAEAKEIMNSHKDDQTPPRQICISTTKVAGDNYVLEGWQTCDFKVTEIEDPEFPAYVVAFCIPNDENPNLYDVYVISEDDCLIKAKSTFQACFYGYTEMETNDFVSRLETSEVTRLKNMFCNCGKLTDLDISNFSAENTTDSTGMFCNCTSLETLHIENLNTGVKVRYFEDMFAKCTSLHTVYTYCNNEGSENFEDGHMYLDITSAYDLNRIFDGCVGLTAITLSGNHNGYTPLGLGYNRSINIERAGTNSIKTAFTGCTSLTELNLIDIKIDNDRGAKQQVYNGTTYNYNDSITSLNELILPLKSSLQEITISGCAFPKVENFNKLFQNFTSLVKCSIIESSNFNNVSSAQNMFEGCSSLKYVDLSDGGMIIEKDNMNLSNMFRNCTALTGIKDTNDSLNYFDLSAFSDGKANTVNYMFYGCSSLRTPVLDTFDTSNAVNLKNMFQNCTSLGTDNEELTMNISHASEIENIFAGCSRLYSVRFEGNTDIDKTEVKINSYFKSSGFNQCSSLKKLSFKNLKFISLRNDNNGNLAKLFGSNDVKAQLTDIEMVNITFTNNTVNYKETFAGLTNLENVTFKNVTCSNTNNTMTGMFKNCTSLKKIEGLNTIDTQYVKDMSYMFDNCYELESIDLSGTFTTVAIPNDSTKIQYMFGTSSNSKNSKLKTIYATANTELAFQKSNNKSAVVFGDKLISLSGAANFIDNKNGNVSGYNTSQFANRDNGYFSTK